MFCLISDLTGTKSVRLVLKQKKQKKIGNNHNETKRY